MQVAGEVIAQLVQNSRGADEGGDVQVVPAGVHRPGGGRHPVVGEVLLHREGVHVAAQEDHRPLGARWGGGTAPQHGDHGREPLAESDLQIQSGQRIEHLLLGAGEVQPDLGVPVQITAQCDEVIAHRPRQVQRGAHQSTVVARPHAASHVAKVAARHTGSSMPP